MVHVQLDVAWLISDNQKLRLASDRISLDYAAAVGFHNNNPGIALGVEGKAAKAVCFDALGNQPRRYL